MKKKVCVIGAGPSGLVAIKELIDKNIDVKCFESYDSIGGAFRTTDKGGRSYDSLKLTVSNYFMAYSDFMPQGEDRKYWSVSEYRKYILDYITFFDLKKHIYLSHKVVSAKIHEDKVIVTVNHLDNSCEEVFDYLIICTGSNFIPKFPKLIENSIFEGEILHSSAYKNAKEFEGKNVVCVGLGESGADIVHEIANVANSCKVIVRNYPNVIPRWINGFTNDAYTSHCFYALNKKGIDRYMKLKSWYYLKFDKTMSEADRIIQQWIKKRESFMGKFFTKSDIFIQDIIDGRIELIIDNLKSFTKKGMVTGKNEEINTDVIMLNTGYKTSFEAYEFGKDFENPRKLFKQMLHPDYGTKVSLIGWARPSQGGLPACSEMQARYMALLISGEQTIPTHLEMESTILVDTNYYKDFFSESVYIESLVCYHNFMKSMGNLIGCNPKMIYPKNLSLSKKMFFGSHISSFYRLPAAAAEKTIMSLPIAYSKRRSTVILMFIMRYNPLSMFKFVFGRV